MNGDDELDVHELQYFFHDIEPENPVTEPDSLVWTMKRAMKQVVEKKEEFYTISWQEFRENYAELDVLIEKGAPQVCLLHLTCAKYCPSSSSSSQQVHLSLLADGTWSTVIVVWIVKGGEEEKQPPSFVRYGNVSGSYSFMQVAKNRTYDVGIDGWKGTIYEAWMTGLTQCQTYYYK